MTKAVTAPHGDGNEVAKALLNIGLQLRNLGNGDAATHMGAIEAHSIQIKEGCAAIAGALESVAEALKKIAHNMEEKSK